MRIAAVEILKNVAAPDFRAILHMETGQFAIHRQRVQTVAVQRGRASGAASPILLDSCGESSRPHRFAIAAIQAEDRAAAALHALNVDAVAPDRQAAVAFTEAGNRP